MKNNKAFSLVELITIIVILGVIMAFTLPNITSTLERNKKDQMIIDAEDMVDKAKNYMLSGKANYPSAGETTTLTLSTIDVRSEILESPFGGEYKGNSYVKVTFDYGIYKYEVCLTDANYTLETSDVSELSKEDKYTNIRVADPDNDCK